MPSIDYVQWVNDALASKPHLSQAGLARHLNRHRSIITLMLRRERQIKASELHDIATYLGEPVPGHSMPDAGLVPIVGRIGNAWYERGEMPSGTFDAIPPVMRHPHASQRQVAYIVDADVDCARAGSIIIARPITTTRDARHGQTVVIERERAGLVNLTIGHVVSDAPHGAIVAVCIEIRTPV